MFSQAKTIEDLQQLILNTKTKLICYDIEPTKDYLQTTIFDFFTWKTLDFYKLLSLRNRHNSTQKKIKQALRQILLTYHPDKIQPETQKQKQQIDERFKCIKKAYEILSDLKTKQQYDSVDPLFDPSIPEDTTPIDFYKTYRSVFQRNSRYSKRHPVPENNRQKDIRCILQLLVYI
eukprot:GHVR01117614.1.p1 GENE.GHVR01117614.1~~GHVR01117614.1.p1  ORF type:complete len:176 (-),score=5.52 GHVR01117614.1:818-1345(-)